MGNFREFGKMILKHKIQSEFFSTAHNAAITGTGWPNRDTLKKLGFKVHRQISFRQLNIDIVAAPGHDCYFLIGEWHDQPYVVSVGRVHLYQNCGRYGEESPLRQWLAVLFAVIGGGTRIVATSAVGGQGEGIEDGMITMPTGIHAIGVSTPHLIGDEFTSPEMLLQDPDGRRASIFTKVADKSGLSCKTDTGHRVIEGRRFGNKLSRQVYLAEGCQTVGMSLVPVLDAACVENRDRADNPIKVMPALYVTDAHDFPDSNDIASRAKQDAPKLAKFLDAMVQEEW
ncbi:MAG: hypothetical protein ABIH21_01780 [Patescibacteria group bacterium]